MEIKIYANYGVLAHEKEPVFTVGCPIEENLADELTVIIPDEFEPYEAQYGAIALTLSGRKYLLREVLTNRGDDPVLSWYDGKEHWKKLKVKA